MLRKRAIRDQSVVAAALLSDLITRIEDARGTLPANTPIVARELLDFAVSQCKAAIAQMNLADRYNSQSALAAARPAAKSGGISAKAAVAMLIAGGALTPVAEDAWEVVKHAADAVIHEVVEQGRGDGTEVDESSVEWSELRNIWNDLLGKYAVVDVANDSWDHFSKVGDEESVREWQARSFEASDAAKAIVLRFDALCDSMGFDKERVIAQLRRADGGDAGA